jgi:hypothetical protein
MRRSRRRPARRRTPARSRCPRRGGRCRGRGPRRDRRLDRPGELAVGGRTPAGHVVGVVAQGLGPHQQGDRAAGVGGVTAVAAVVGVEGRRLLAAQGRTYAGRDVEEGRLGVDQWSPDRADPQDDRPHAGAREAVGDERLGRLLEGDDQVRQLRGGEGKVLGPAGLRPADVDAEARCHGEAANGPGAGGVERVQERCRVVAEEGDRVLAGDAAREVDDAADVVALAEGEEGVAVVDVERLHRHPAGEERRHLGAAVGGDDDLFSFLDQRAGGVGADHAEPAGDEDHRSTS